MESEISAAILAGGSAKRLGGIIKPDLIVGGKSILSRNLAIFTEIFTEIVLVSNSREQGFKVENLQVITDIIKGKGPLGGIHSAIKHTDRKAVFIFAGDMPLLDKTLILDQISRFKELHSNILVPKTGDLIEPLHAIYSKSISGMLETYLSENSVNAVRDFLMKAGTAFFEPSDAQSAKRAFMNINSPRDIVIAEETLRKG